MNLPNVRDAELIETKALPADAGSVYSDAIDLGALSAAGARLEQVEALLTAPTLTSTQMPSNTTIAYDIQASNDSGFNSITTLASSAISATSNSGITGSTYRFKIPSNCPRYLRAKATTADVGNDAAGNCAGSSMTLELLF